MIRTLLISLLAIGATPLALAADAEPAPAPAAAPGPEKPAPARGKAAKNPWSYRATLHAVYDSNIEQDENEKHSRGYIGELAAKYKTETPVGDLELDYEIGAHRYTNTDSWDRTTHDFEAILESNLGGQWRAQTTGEVSIKDSSDDGDIRDVYSLEQRLEYRITPVYRLRVRGAVRKKKYDEDPRRDSNNPYYGVSLVQRYPNGWRWDVGYRYDKNSADDGRFSYRRWTYDSTLSHDLDDRNAVELGIRSRVRRHLERWISTPVGVEPRTDRYWTFETRWDHNLRKNLDLRLRYEYETRRSNDTGSDYDDHLLATTLTQRW